MKILIIDDEPFIRKSLAALITRLNTKYTIVGEARNGTEAIELLSRIRPDVVFTDIRMPGMSGIELAEHIAANYSNIQTVILSGYAEFEYARAAIDSGVVSYLLKPTKINELKSALEKISSALSAKNLPSTEEETNEILIPKVECRAIVQEIINLVEEHYAENISLSEIAGMVHLNPKYMSTLFRKETGERFNVYLTRIRLQQAKKLLIAFPYLHIYEVAQKVGYENTKHFISVFRQWFSVTPRQYREQNAEEN